MVLAFWKAFSGRFSGWTTMPFSSKTVEGSVWTLVQDVRSWADGCLSPARLLPRGRVFTWKRSVPAGRQVFCVPPTRMRSETRVLHSLGCLEIDGLSCFFWWELGVSQQKVTQPVDYYFLRSPGFPPILVIGECILF